MKNLFLTLWHHFQKDSLFRNSMYLMASQGVLGVLGFFFWILVARLSSPSSVGVATALISAMTLLSSLGQLGFNISLLRYLPKSLKRNEQINSVMIVVFVASITLSLLFIGGISIFAPKLLFLKENLLYIFSFSIFVAAAALNTIIDSVFMAYRTSIYVLFKNIILSVVKLSLPLFLIFLGAYGIFSSVALATLLSFCFGYIMLLFKHSFSPMLSVNKNALSEMGKFSAGNYIAGFLSQAPTLILPILIINRDSPETAAYYYVSSMILGFLMIVSLSTTQSLLVEGSHEIEAVRKHFLKAVKIILGFLIPAIIIIVLFGDLILRAFGKNYAVQSFMFLRIMSVSAIFMALSSLGNSLFRLYHKIADLILVNAITAIIPLGLSYVFIPYGLMAIGWAWLISQIISVFIYWGFLRLRKIL